MTFKFLNENKRKLFLLFFLLFLVISLFLVKHFKKPSFVSQDQNKSAQTSLNFSAQKDTVPLSLLDKKILSKLTPELKEIAEFEATKPLFQGQNSRQKILEAYQKGDISQEEAIKLKIFAYFSPNKLPSKYQADDNSAPLSGWQADVIEIMTNWNKFSQETKDFLIPFILPPDKEGSFFNPNNKPEDFFRSPLSRSFIKSAQASVSWLKEKITAQGEASDSWLFYYLPSNANSSQQQKIQNQVQIIKKAWRKSWPQFKQYLGTAPQKGVDVYLVANLNNSFGVTYPYVTLNNQMDHCLIEISDSIANEKILSATIAHELFHCFQFFYDPIFLKDNKNVQWLMEATAVWSENFIYPNYNTEHEYLPVFFSNLFSPLIKTGGTWEYSSYILFFFADQYTGNKETVAKVFNELKNKKKVKEAVKLSLGNYFTAYQNFLVYNWNRYDGKKYQDIPSFPKIYPQTTQSQTGIYFDQPARKNVNQSYQPGAMFYYYYVFDLNKEKVRYIKFNFKKSSGSQIIKQAFIKYINNDQWQLQDWRGRQEISFCRDLPQQEVQAIVLAAANPNLNKREQFNYSIEVQDQCPTEPFGYFIIKDNGQASNQVGYVTSETIFVAEQKLKYVPDFEKDVNDNTKEYKIVSQNLSCYSYFKNVMDLGVDFFDLSGQTSMERYGSLSEEYTEEDWRSQLYTGLVIDPDKKKVILNTNPTTKNKEWITSIITTEFSQDINKEDSCGDLPEEIVVDYDGGRVLQGEITVDPAKIIPALALPNTKAGVTIEYFYYFP